MRRHRGVLGAADLISDTRWRPHDDTLFIGLDYKLGAIGPGGMGPGGPGPRQAGVTLRWQAVTDRWAGRPPAIDSLHRNRGP